jgi:arylsulfatase A-like enzyme
MDALDRKGLREQTIVILTTDHGCGAATFLPQSLYYPVDLIGSCTRFGGYENQYPGNGERLYGE